MATTGIWTEVETKDQIHICSSYLQSSRTRYKDHLTAKNLKNLLKQTVNDDGVDFMFEMALYQDDDDSDYDLVLVQYLSLGRDEAGTAAFNQWCLTFGVSPTTTKTAAQLYAILKAEIQAEMDEDPDFTFWYVYLDTDKFNSGNLFDQIVQLLFADIVAGKVIVGPDDPVPPYAAFAKDNPGAVAAGTKLHRFEIRTIN
jgi:hypothetical protein